MADGRISQLVAEVAGAGTPSARVSGCAVEVLALITTAAEAARCSQVTVETLAILVADELRCSQLAVEAVSSILRLIISIDEVERTTQSRSALRIEYALGMRGGAEVEAIDVDSTETAYRPAIDDRLLIRYGVYRLFNGSIFSVTDRPILSPHIATSTAAQGVDDWSRAAQRRVTETYPDGTTLHDAVADLVTTYLSTFGLSLDPTMAAGPALPLVTFEYVTLEAAFNRLAELTGWVYRLTPYSVIEWFAIGTRSVGLTLSAANHNIIGPVRWTKTRRDYINRVVVRYGGDTQETIREDWTADGTTAIFPLAYPGVLWPDGMTLISRGVVNEDAIDYAIAIWGVDVGYTWYYDVAIHAIRRASLPTAGAEIWFEYRVQFPLTITVEDAADIAVRGPWEERLELPDVTDVAEATAQAEARLRRGSAMPRTVYLSCRELPAILCLPGDVVNLDVPWRTLPDDDWLVIGKTLTVGIDQQLSAALTLLEGTEAQASWVDYWRAAFGGAA